MTRVKSDPAPAPRALDIPPERLPRHIAIIMDGNGRWAMRRDQPRLAGHHAGARIIRDIISECGRLGIEALTLYSFSMENWSRPVDEVRGLMELYLEYLIKERSELVESNVRFVQIGRRDGLPQQVLDELDRTTAATASSTGLTVAAAINYGSRTEITDAVRSIVREVQEGRLDPEHITEETVDAHLYTTGLPDPDLLIRTAGEMRLSNYLLWQISYAELHVTDVLWPDFDIVHLHEALRDFASRQRRFGGLNDTDT